VQQLLVGKDVTADWILGGGMRSSPSLEVVKLLVAVLDDHSVFGFIIHYTLSNQYRYSIAAFLAIAWLGA
jgi:hypothetical protein